MLHTCGVRGLALAEPECSTPPPTKIRRVDMQGTGRSMPTGASAYQCLHQGEPEPGPDRCMVRLLVIPGKRSQHTKMTDLETSGSVSAHQPCVRQLLPQISPPIAASRHLTRPKEPRSFCSRRWWLCCEKMCVGPDRLEGLLASSVTFWV